MNGQYVVRTLGCKANLSDSQLIEAELKTRGWDAASRDGEPEGVGLCVINSCTVTDEADRQTKKLAARLAKDFPNARVVVTGCGAEVDPESFARSKGVDFVIGNQDKPGLVEQVLEALEGGKPAQGQVLGKVLGYDELRSRHPMDREWPMPERTFVVPPSSVRGDSHRKRAFLKIQEGCNSFCTYCIIPYGRGPARSLRPRQVIDQVRALVAEGVQEVVITGTNVGDYGFDWAGHYALGELLELMLSETRIERVRVSSLDPTEITPEILSLMRREPRFMPHFHVSLQSPSSKILKLMKRKYAYEQVRECLLAIADVPAPAGGPFVGMDVITGFPSETPEDFEWTVKALEDLPWSRLHVFPYSERASTPATKLPGSVYQHERIRRARVLGELSLSRLEKTYRAALEQARSSGEPMRGILLESRTQGPDGKRGWISGYSPNYLRVLVQLGPDDAGTGLTGYENRLVDAAPHTLVMDPAGGDAVLLASLA